MAGSSLAKKSHTPNVRRGPSPKLVRLQESITAGARRARQAAADRRSMLVGAVAAAGIGYLEDSGTFDKINPLPVDSTVILAALAFVPGKSKVMSMVQDVGGAAATIASYKLGRGELFGDADGGTVSGNDWAPAV